MDTLKRNSIPDTTSETVYQVAAVREDGTLKICDHYDTESGASELAHRLSLKSENLYIKFVVVEMKRLTTWKAKCTEVWSSGCTRDDAPTFTKESK